MASAIYIRIKTIKYIQKMCNGIYISQRKFGLENRRFQLLKNLLKTAAVKGKQQRHS